MTDLDALRRRLLALVGLACVTLGLSACGTGIAGLDSLTGEQQNSVAPQGTTIGTGPVKVALILPLGSANGAVAAVAIRNAAELALDEFQSRDITLLVKDDRGTAAGTEAAVRQALSEGAEIVLGPVFAQNVQAATPIARAAGKPIIAFSSDQAVAGRNVYLLSFLPQSDIDRVIDYAASRGKKSLAIFAPQSLYGDVATQNAQVAASRAGLRIAAIERYQPGQAAVAASRLKASISTADTLFLAEEPQGLAGATQALAAAGIRHGDVQVIGTSVWNMPAAIRSNFLQGAWFAAPERDGFESFANRYKKKYGDVPPRLATLGFDAVALVAALTKTQGSQRFQEQVLTNPSGFAGQDGVFRFRSDGTNDRALAVYQIGNGRVTTLSPAPKTFKQ